ncbi:hypothetical protein Ana3638_05205 [Anaerocolumna sedimenticola]|uniref:Prepilin type IV endopeptidase peptidase domain-containing protein n=2 Tax=Anaerocolumna sedimenticola TaxID=2696063 RepID=A0A6P1TJN0_9FIRM|nr:hypothetical protein Ana3638_05205 [Anaerocolumna sedimenticola]
MDLKSYKISNLIITFGLILGFIMNYSEQGWTSLSLCFFGMLLPVLLLFPLFLMKALGAGDIKLFSVVGCFCGAANVYHSIGAAFVIAAFLSMLHLIKHRYVVSGLNFFQSIFQISKSIHLIINKLPKSFYKVKYEIEYFVFRFQSYPQKQTKSMERRTESGYYPGIIIYQEVREEEKKKTLPAIRKYCERRKGSKQGVIHFSPAILIAVLIHIFQIY